VLKIDLNNCDQEWCYFHRGSNFKFIGEFISNQDTKCAETKVTNILTVGDANFPVPGVAFDACEMMPCPLVKGGKYRLEYDMIVPKFLPLLHADIMAELYGEKGRILCLIFKGVVTD